MEAQPTQSALAVSDHLQLECSSRTIVRRLRESGLLARIIATKPVLAGRNNEDRIAFTRQYIDLPIEFWQRVIFCDEKVFSSEGLRPQSVWRRINTRYKEENIVPSSRSDRITGGVWGWIAWSGVGEIVEINGCLTSAEYVNILEDVFLPSVRAVFAEEEALHVYLAQDNSPIHSGRVVSDWFASHPEVTLLDWPSRSPDLNPIEYVWAQMSKDWLGCNGRNRKELFDYVRELWEKLRLQPNLLQNLVQLMPHRLRDVILADGGYTKY
ncbi:hypothetical protein Pcinc_000794 [Petrolisthes cinctipes]|uniref:Transposase n=1 Tax=Petrolisthes cinctipes TaxID=88211 RepID=A0AAE1GMW7_PETCI|nr:hypothetical protein Pcinc_000794 [Petrolisthes cinctipes]